MHTDTGAPTARARIVAWAGAVVFVASLVYFLFMYAVRFGEPAPITSAAAAVLIDTLLFTAFALHHSVFARGAVRARVALVVPSYLERSAYVWVASVLFVAVCALWQPVPGVLWRVHGPVAWVLLGLQAVGIWLTVRGAAVIDVLELSGIRQLTPRTHEPQFKTSGPYGWVRHPIYSGWFLMVFCVASMTMTRLVFAAISSAYLLIAIPFEERSLVSTSNGAYERYARQVRWKLLPGIY